MIPLAAETAVTGAVRVGPFGARMLTGSALAPTTRQTSPVPVPVAVLAKVNWLAERVATTALFPFSSKPRVLVLPKNEIGCPTKKLLGAVAVTVVPEPEKVVTNAVALFRTIPGAS